MERIAEAMKEIERAIIWLGICILFGSVFVSCSIQTADAAEFGVVEEDGSYIEAVEGEMYVALIETAYSINNERTQAAATILVHDYQHKLVEGARVYVQWSTRDGKTNYCTTRENGRCTLRNNTDATRKPEPIFLKVIGVEHPTLSWFNVTGWESVWVIQPSSS